MPRLKTCPDCGGEGNFDLPLDSSKKCAGCNGTGKVLAHLKPLGPGTAEISDCGLYRRTLTRELGGDRPLAICGLNPSVARHDIDDPTIRKECHFTIAWGFGRLIKANAYDYRSTDPKAMWLAASRGIAISTPENNAAIRAIAAECVRLDGKFLVAWGSPSLSRKQAAPHEARIAAIVELLGGCPLFCVGVNFDGSPKHPLYLPNDVTPQPWQLRRAA